MTLFKIIGAADPSIIERELNRWSASLPTNCRIKRTQLASAGLTVYVLVSYEAPAPDKDSK